MRGGQAGHRTAAAPAAGESNVGLAERELLAAPGAEADAVDGAAKAGRIVDAGGRSSWRHAWQVPSILLSGILIVLGIQAAIRPARPQDFDGALAQVQELVYAGKCELAATRLRNDIEPNLKHASIAQQARFHVLVGDVMLCWRQSQRIENEDAIRRVLGEYSKAEGLGLTLDAAHLERAAELLLSINDVPGVRKRLAQLDAMDAAALRASASADGDEGGEADPTIRASRNRVFRKLVEHTLRQPDCSYDELARLLIDYRSDSRAELDDEAWAIARLAELRLDFGHAQQAVDLLLLDMRRIESRIDPAENPGYGELYALLGRGYSELGDDERASMHLNHALRLLGPSDPVRGDALLLMGRIAASQGQLEQALEQFHVVVRDFIGTRSYLPGLLARAEIEAVLGDHAASLEDYRLLAELLPDAGPRRDMTPLRVAESLCDRHDAALTLGKLDQALEYVRVAETLFESSRVPLEVLYRLASTNRQIADDMIAHAAPVAEEQADPELPLLIDPAVRHQANLHYQRAGEYYLRHANAERPPVAVATSVADWAHSLWMAADSFDRGGRHELAIEHFKRYLDSQPMDDQRRPEAIYQLSQCYLALMDYHNAIAGYEKVIAEYPRSSFAAQSHVPLARCYLAVDRANDAQRQLRQVLSGDRLLQPDAREYRNALIELGRICHAQDQHADAIELLAEAADRYPDDPRRPEIVFLLADSYRRSAAAIAERLRAEPAMAPTELGRLTTLRLSQLNTALETFADVCETYGAANESTSRLQPDLLRRAHLYRADCAFELGHYEEAVQLYEQAARQFNAHSSSMYALVQIVNCYSQMGDAERAAAAHRRALVRLRQLPDDAFASPDALMDRAAWERWLENSPVGSVQTASADGLNR